MRLNKRSFHIETRLDNKILTKLATKETMKFELRDILKDNKSLKVQKINEKPILVLKVRKRTKKERRAENQAVQVKLL